MATQNLKFIKSSVAQVAAENKGAIWFDPTNKVIKVSTGTAWESYYGLADASWNSTSKVLTITKPNGETVALNLQDMASADALSKLTDRVSTLEGKHAEGKTVAQEAAAAASAAVSGIGTSSKSNTAGSDVVVTVGANSGKITSVAVDASVLAKKVSDEASARATGDSNTLAAAKQYTNDEVDKVKASVASVYKVKGSCLYADLAKKTDSAVGDVWNVTDANGNTPAGTNYVWTGETWDALGGTIDLSPYALKSSLSGYKTTQSAVALTNTAGKTITGLSQNAQGVVSATFGDIAIAQSQVSGLSTALDGKMSASANGSTIYTDTTKKTTINDAIADAKKAGSDASAAISTAINALDATVSNTAANAGTAATTQIKATIVETDGKLASVAINAPAFDLSGAASGVRTELLGDSTKDTASSNTIAGAKKYADNAASTAASNVSVSAKGDDYVSASASGKAVTVGATTALTNAVKAANSAVQTVGKATGAETFLTVSQSGTGVTIGLTGVQTAINTAAAGVKVSVKNGTYVSGSVDSAGRIITLSEKVQAVSGASDSTKGLAEASDVKTYVDNKVANSTSMMWAEFA